MLRTKSAEKLSKNKNLNSVLGAQKFKRQMGHAPHSAPVYATHNTCEAFSVNLQCHVPAIFASASTDAQARKATSRALRGSSTGSGGAKSSRSSLRTGRRPSNLRPDHGDHVRGDQ